MRMGWPAGAVVLAVVVVLSGCGGASAGDYTVPAPTGGASSSGLPGSSAGADSEPGAESSPSASSCEPGWIAPAGGLFCFPLPAGFQDESERADYGQGWPYRAMVSIGPLDFVQVTAVVADEDFDRLGDIDLERRYMSDRALLPGVDGIAKASAFVPGTVDGARSIRQNGLFSGGVAIDQTLVYTGSIMLRILCDSSAQPDAVADACEAVHTGIVILR